MADREESNNQDNKKKGINPVAAGVAGAVVGAGLAASANKVLQNKKMRKTAEDLIDRAKEKANDFISDQMPSRNEVKKKVATARKQISKQSSKSK